MQEDEAPGGRSGGILAQSEYRGIVLQLSDGARGLFEVADEQWRGQEWAVVQRGFLVYFKIDPAQDGGGAGDTD